MGFEPTVRCRTHAFQACALSHSAISPKNRLKRALPSWAPLTLRRGQFRTNQTGGEGGIRTLERLPVTPLAGARLQPLGHLSTRSGRIGSLIQIPNLHGIGPPGRVPTRPHTPQNARPNRLNGGEGGIRTHERLRVAGFQDRCRQPLGYLSAMRNPSPIPDGSGPRSATIRSDSGGEPEFPARAEPRAGPNLPNKTKPAPARPPRRGRPP